ncbi:MAG: replication initiation protein [Mitsuokella jalaludinii]|nr:replication initiation protein [Mitsuokella jalaludinii]
MKELPLPRDCQINPMIDGTKQMNILEMRLFWLALDDVRTQLATRGGSCQDGFDALRILPGQVKRIFANGSYLERLASACDLLRSWSIDWQDEDEDDVIYKVFRTIGYQPKDGLTIKFNPSMQPFLLDLYYERPGFEKCSLAQLFQLSSAHAVHLLAWLLQYRRTRRRETLTRYIDVNDLRCLLYIEASQYPLMAEFKRRVLDAPIREINKRTQYRLSYEATKVGRKITGFTFTMDCSDLDAGTELEEITMLERTSPR